MATIQQWADTIGNRLAADLGNVPYRLGNPNIGGDGPRICEDAPAYVSCELQPIAETVEPWPSPKTVFDGSAPACPEYAVQLAFRLVMCVPTGDAEGRPAPALLQAASAAEVAASGEAMARSLWETRRVLRTTAGFGAMTVGEVTPSPKQGGVMAWTAEAACRVAVDC